MFRHRIAHRFTRHPLTNQVCYREWEAKIRHHKFVVKYTPPYTGETGVTWPPLFSVSHNFGRGRWDLHYTGYLIKDANSPRKSDHSK